MIGQYKSAIIRLKNLLNKVKLNPENLSTLLELQLLLIEYIKRVESRARRLKVNGKDSESAKHALFVLKSFGDALAFLYIDRFNLKQMSFNLGNEAIKASSGFISEKIGFDFELQKLKEYIEDGFPCLLCDLTNSIRYGDILMLFSGGDPFVVECKLSKQNNQRSRRQFAKLKELREFYDNDKKRINQGLVEVTRVASILPRVDYSSKMNELIHSARVAGSVSEKVETGVYYFVSFDSAPLESQISKYNFKTPWVTFLNQYKNDNNWISYFPFTLSIENTQDLLDFILGKLVLMVVIEVSEVSRILPGEKVHFETNEDSNHPFVFYLHDANGGSVTSQFAISVHILMRVPLEFLSLEWIVKDSYARWNSMRLD